MKLGHQFVRVASNDGAGVKPLADGQIFPSLPKTSKHEREVISREPKAWETYFGS